MDFDRPIDRRNTHASKWDVMETNYGVSPDDGIALWVADMDFAPPEAVTDAFRDRVEHGVFGYFGDDRELRAAVQGWMHRRHHWTIEPEWIVTCHGIVAALAQAVQALSEPGDGVVIHTPIYYPFSWAIRWNKRVPVINPLALVDNQYQIDFDDLADRIDDRTRLVLLCSPHNPGGRAWPRDQLERLAELAIERDLIIVNDEIHHDIVYDDATHTVMATLGPEVSERLITFAAASKTFNLAGLGTGIAIIENPALRERFQRGLARGGVHGPNLFGALGTTAAYSHGDEWADALIAYLQSNRDRVAEVLADQLPEVTAMRLDGTYLAWLDFTATGLPDDEIAKRLEQHARLALSHGPTYGAGGEQHMRLNFALPRARLDEALDRLVSAF